MAIASKCICGHSPNYCNDSVKECMKRIDLSFRCKECEGKEKEIAELKGKINELTMDNMTHEYNNAEAEKYAPEYKRQIEEPLLEKIEELKAENERLKGLIEELYNRYVRFSAFVHDENDREIMWQQFKTENQL